ncbi:MAG: ScyD/ScyE family protein [Proteobacteria bacterium]|nr:ScyD/ScyE family protein [Pseudomonadota bacterium]
MFGRWSWLQLAASSRPSGHERCAVRDNQSRRSARHGTWHTDEILRGISRSDGCRQFAVADNGCGNVTAGQHHQSRETIMKPNKTGKRLFPRLAPIALSIGLALVAIPPTEAFAQAQCTQVLGGLRLPVGTALTPRGNLLIAESGDGTPNSGRISIVDSYGNQRTLLDGMPSGPADVGTPSGPDGLFMQGRALYVAMGEGDIAIMGPRPGTALLNPDGPNSPIFSSILEIDFSGATENRTTGFTMTTADQDALAKGRIVWLRDGRRNTLRIRMVSDFPDYIPFPLPDVPDNIEATNPFGIVGLGAAFYVNDGGRNQTWRVDRFNGAASQFVAYPDVPNPLFGQGIGGPTIQAVPTGIEAKGHQLLVSLFRGAPFATGVSSIETVDALTGSDVPLITNLTTAIDTIALGKGRHGDLLVLENSSAGPFFAGPGTVLQFDGSGGAPTTVADCLVGPTSMTLDKRNNTLYVTEEEGNLISIPFQP